MLMLSCWYKYFGNYRSRGRIPFLQECCCEIEKGHGEVCVEQQRLPQPTRPWIAKHMGRGGIKNVGYFPLGLLWLPLAVGCCWAGVGS